MPARRLTPVTSAFLLTEASLEENVGAAVRLDRLDPGHADALRHALRGQVLLVGERDDPLRTEMCQAGGEACGGGLGRVSAAPIRARERVAELDVPRRL